MRNLSCFPRTTNLEQLLLLQGPVAMWELSLSMPTRSSRRLHSEPLSGTVPTLSSWTKLAVHICTCGCIQSGESQQPSYNPTGCFSFAPHTLTSRPSSSTERAVFIVASVAFRQRRIIRATKDPPGSLSYQVTWACLCTVQFLSRLEDLPALHRSVSVLFGGEPL